MHAVVIEFGVVEVRTFTQEGRMDLIGEGTCVKEVWQNVTRFRAVIPRQEIAQGVSGRAA